MTQTSEHACRPGSGKLNAARALVGSPANYREAYLTMAEAYAELAEAYDATRTPPIGVEGLHEDVEAELARTRKWEPHLTVLFNRVLAALPPTALNNPNDETERLSNIIDLIANYASGGVIDNDVANDRYEMIHIARAARRGASLVQVKGLQR